MLIALLETIFATIVTFGLLVTVHEYGHFWVAQRCGVKVLRFSIGFGKALYTHTDRNGVVFSFAAIPLGGYVKMLDEREGAVAEVDLPHAFNRQSVGRRIAIVSAGPVANFLLAIVVYSVMFMTGVTAVVPVIGQVSEGSLAEKAGLQAQHEITSIDGIETASWKQVQMALLNHVGDSDVIELQVRSFGNDTQNAQQNLSIPLQRWLANAEMPNVLGSLGISPYRPEVKASIHQIVKGGAADRAGLQSQDIVISIDDTPINAWGDLVMFVQAHPAESVTFEIIRNGSRLLKSVTLDSYENDKGKVSGRVGIEVEMPVFPENMRRNLNYSLPEALVEAVSTTWDMVVLTLVSIKKILQGSISIKNISGPITIAQVAGASVEQGFETFLSFLAYLSVSLGIINLLPIPLLDGGYLMYYLVEIVRGKSVSEKVQMLGLRIGIGIIVTLMLFALYNDLMRIL